MTTLKTWVSKSNELNKILKGLKHNKNSIKEEQWVKKGSNSEGVKLLLIGDNKLNPHMLSYTATTYIN